MGYGNGYGYGDDRGKEVPGKEKERKGREGPKEGREGSFHQGTKSMYIYVKRTMTNSAGKLMFFLGLLLTVSHTVLASDPDLTTDTGINSTSASDFTFTGFRNLQAGGKGVATPTFASFNNVPGLTGLGLTAVVFEFGPQSQISPHTHPRATEIFYVTSGQVEVGFVDTSNNLFETTLQTGDLFVFPKGLLHFQRNNGWTSASGFSALSSENPGTLMVASALFTSRSGTGLPDNVLSTAFGIDDQTVEIIKRSLATSG